MRFESRSHLYAETVLRYDFPEVYRDLVEVLGGMEAPLRSAGPFKTGRPSVPKRQRVHARGSSRFALFPIDQDALNRSISAALRERGWKAEPVATAGMTVPEGVGPLHLKGDFVKQDVFVEVEFGNMASTYRDIFKFVIAHRSGAGEVAVLITGTRRMMKFCDQGVATYEGSLRMLPYLKIGVQMPVWLVGVEPEDWEAVRARYDEMYRIASDNGIECHPFVAIFGADLPVEEITEDHLG